MSSSTFTRLVWGVEGFFESPSLAHARPDKIGWNAVLFCPLGDKLGDAVKLKLLHVDPIAILLRGRGPSAIPGLVASVVVDAVKRVSVFGVRAFAHVVKEAREVLPSFANSDPSATIAVEPLVVGIGAALDHGQPRAMFWRVGHAVLESLGVGSFFDHAATASQASVGRQNGGLDHSRSSAIARAFPQSITAIIAANHPNGGQEAELLSSQVRGGSRHYGSPNGSVTTVSRIIGQTLSTHHLGVA